ncbi:MAG: toll/interleukin-1 receptor domain-containing protein [Chloroflexi bacterium]|nr:toll/interleukin-1 receptor domain-containing protein [Chloroflexota bacterium]MXX84027.1 toll/interleukin-1 receptor domain-containing protein [Chloroflexota bacterium]MYA94064.1 toll/interleukin-1 receptor domain-containing protein [Chloroflexota bacterium]MYC55288.1 toll/interleukin-1 receptor domain-containing protein [Chloroflexota bacterium]MYD38127.1 toll/interleukin-1 receptor domain-containing protein [Chloroflexota bacterium]
MKKPAPSASMMAHRKCIAWWWRAMSSNATAPASPMPPIFISHSNQDNALIEPIVTRLREADWRIWIDYENIRGGAEWLCEIEAGIARCHAVLVILSKSSAGSAWVKRECLYAFQLQKPLLVALVADVLIPLHLINLQYCDLRAPQGMSKLLDSLRALSAEGGAGYAQGAVSETPLASNFFPYLAQLPQGDIAALVAQDLYAFAQQHADAVEFGGRQRPGFHARLNVGGRRATWFSVWAYRKQPAIQLNLTRWAKNANHAPAELLREWQALLPASARPRATLPLRCLDSDDKLESLKSILLEIKPQVRL